MLEQIVSGIHTRLYARAYIVADPAQDRYTCWWFVLLFSKFMKPAQLIHEQAAPMLLFSKFMEPAQLIHEQAASTAAIALCLSNWTLAWRLKQSLWESLKG